MNDITPSAEPTATSLKKELSESLAILKTDFESLNHFVAELSPDGSSAPISLTRGDLNDLLSVAQETQDAASDIEFEASKIKEKLSRFIA
jgi:hypothetical protein